jgi:NTE family protein
MKRNSSKSITYLCVYILFFIVFITSSFSQTENSQQTKTRPSVALVLGGGGAKGFGIIPVLEVIEELGIPIDMVIGNSIGAIVGGLYSIGYTPAEIHQITDDINWASIFSDRTESPLESLLESRSIASSPFSIKFKKDFSIETNGGFSSGQNAHLLFKQLSVKIPSYVDFDSLPIPFRATAVNLVTGKLELIGSGDLAEALRSSMSIPGVFQPFPIDDKLYVDGFVRNNLPIQQARDMGYDIIISVSLDRALKDNSEDFASTPFSTLLQVALIVTSAGNPEQLELADLVIYPPVDDYTMMDFPKAREIYAKSEKQKNKYRTALEKLLPLIYPDTEGRNTSGLNTNQAEQSISHHNTENITRNHFSFTPSHPFSEEKEGLYASIPYIVPNRIVLYGAVKSDEAFIHEVFKRIKGKSLTPTNLKFLVNSIYNTGNYSLVLPRVDVRPQQTVIEIRLQQKEKENWIIIPNATFMGTLTDDSITKLTLALDLQFRGLTGTGSVMSLKTTAINNFGASWLYLQPLGPHAYLQLSAAAHLDQEFITSGFTSRTITADKFAYTNIDFLWGLKFNEKHKIQTGGAIYWINTEEVNNPDLEARFELYPDSIVNSVAPLNIRYTFSTFDTPIFPNKGFYVRLDSTGVFPIMNKNVPVAFNMTKIDFSAAIPVAPKFSLIINTMAASDPSLQLEQIPNLIPFFGLTLGDRMFFPNISGSQKYGTQKFAAQAVLQFQPWDDITVIGGQLFFNITGTAGIIAMNYKDFSTDGINWNASIGAGLRINKTFNVFIVRPLPSVFCP